ncbi:MAG: magnesium transporter [Alphaproteobacteria bacterium]
MSEHQSKPGPPSEEDVRSEADMAAGTAAAAESEAGPEAIEGLSDELIWAIRAALDVDAPAEAAALASTLHVADQADLLEQLGREQRADLLAEIREDLDPELLAHLDETVRAEILEILSPEEVGAAIAQLETDDAIDLLEDMDQPEQAALLEAMPMPERVALEQGLTYPEDSAGRMMQRQLVVAPEFWTVGQTIDYLRADGDLPDDFYDIYIVDPKFRPVGSIPLSRVLRSKRNVHLNDLVMKELHTLPVDMDQEEVGFRFSQYDLTSAPVVDDDGRLLGVITIDDVVEVIEEEAEEDILRLGGVSETDIFASPVTTTLQRFPWLLINLATAILASIVISQFEGAIGQVVALAVLMPIVASMGGNAGTQTLTVVVRALAVREVTTANAFRVLLKECFAGSINGLLFMAAGLAVALLWFGDPLLATLFGLSMVVTLVAGVLAGVGIPLLLDKLGLDPAVSSGVFLTTVTDVVGFFSFLGLATIYLL